MTYIKSAFFFAILGGILCANSPAPATETVWFSTSNINPGAPPAGGVNTITFNNLGPQTLYVWSTDGTPVTPADAYPPQDGSPSPFPVFVPPTSALFSYDLGVTGNSAGAISLTAGSITNPNILNSVGNPFTADTNWDGTVSAGEIVTRWNGASNFTAAGNPANVSASAITGLNASSLPVAIDSAGVPSGILTNIHTGLSTSPNDSFAGDQPGYNAAAHAFLLGQLTFTTISFNTDGSTVLSLNNSMFGIGTGSSTYNQSTQQWTSVTADLSPNFNFGHATIDVVPEPATWLLMALGGAALCFRLKR